MPFVSQAQRGYFHAVEEGKATKPGGPSPVVARKLIAEDQSGKLPFHVKPRGPKLIVLRHRKG